MPQGSARKPTAPKKSLTKPAAMKPKVSYNSKPGGGKVINLGPGNKKPGVSQRAQRSKQY